MPIDIRVIRMNRVGEKKQGHIKAFVDVEINGLILIKGIVVMFGKEGLCVSMPRQRGKDNRWYETVQILNRNFREEVNSYVLLEYENEE